MALSTIEFSPLRDFYLDPSNPRLGRARLDRSGSQDSLMRQMRSWSLEELAVSFLESGFWPQEAVIVVEEELYGPPAKMVVVEGNRRIAALKYLKAAVDGSPVTQTWRRLAAEYEVDPSLFTRVPFILAGSRNEVKSFIGFRHVTGIKEWPPAEKAQFIADLVDNQGLAYEIIRKQIGSRTETVRRSYISYRILLQVEDQGIEISQEGIDRRFSVLFLSLRETPVQEFLGVNVRADPEEARYPVPEGKLEDLGYFSTWLFGAEGRRPLFTDSRDIGDFAAILATGQAVQYLKQSPSPSFEVALQRAGVEQEQVESQLQEANVQMELALSKIHLHLDSVAIQKEMERVALNARELVSKFPEIAQNIGMQIR